MLNVVWKSGHQSKPIHCIHLDWIVQCSSIWCYLFKQKYFSYGKQRIVVYRNLFSKCPSSCLSTLCKTSSRTAMHNGGAHGHFDFLAQCINFYSHSLIFPAILPPLIIYNLFIWWYRWVSGEEYYHFLYFAFSVAQTVQKLQVFCFFWSVNGFRESHKTLQQ